MERRGCWTLFGFCCWRGDARVEKITSDAMCVFVWIYVDGYFSQREEEQKNQLSTFNASANCCWLFPFGVKRVDEDLVFPFELSHQSAWNWIGSRDDTFSKSDGLINKFTGGGGGGGRDRVTIITLQISFRGIVRCMVFVSVFQWLPTGDGFLFGFLAL